jgi:hypothetical protein
LKVFILGQSIEKRSINIHKLLDIKHNCGNLFLLKEIVMDEQTIFHIPDVNLKDFEANCAKLSKKAVKMGCSEIKPFIFGYEMKTLEDGFEHKVYEVLFTVETPKIEGWTFVARLDHANETGNIVRMVPNAGSIPEVYRNCAPKCDHCNINRRRRDTFVLRSEAGEYKQVGSSCLQQFFGIDPLKMARMAELLGYAYEAGRGAEEYTGGLNNHRWLNVEIFCKFAAESVRKHGWVSGKAAYEDPNLHATRDDAMNAYCDMQSRGKVFAEEDIAVADAALEWAQSLRDKATLNDYENNILVIAEASYMELRSIGLAASIVGVYLMNKSREAERLARAAGGINAHLGTVGERLRDIKVNVISDFVKETDFGLMHIYKLKTAEGHMLTWFASKGVLQEGDTVLLTGTVKKHDEYKGQKQTIMTRCKTEKAS